jgi:transformation/transcription domain-associated protein
MAAVSDGKDWQANLAKLIKSTLFSHLTLSSCTLHLFVGATVDSGELDIAKKLIETLPSADLTEYLSIFVPWAVSTLTSLLGSSNPERTRGSREHLLEVISLLSVCGDATKPHLESLLALLVKVLWEDNESNGLTAMHIFMEMHKVYRGLAESSVQPFLDFVLKLLENYVLIAEKLVTAVIKGAGPLNPPALHSVKIIIESPVSVVLLFQLHRKFINDNILKFVPLIFKVLDISLPAPPIPDSAEVGTVRDLSGISGQPRSPVRQAYCDFIQAKVKLLSFLAYVSRSFAVALKPNQAAIPHFVIDILQNCPPESASARKVGLWPFASVCA